DYLLRPFMDAIVNLNVDTVGTASLYAKAMYLLNRDQPYVAEQFILLGDPALRIPKPGRRISLEMTPADIFTDQDATISVRGKVPVMPWGIAEVRILSDESKTVAGPVRGDVSRGGFELKLDLPPWVKPGQYR